MKKIILIPFLFIATFCFAQYPNGIQTLGNDSNMVVAKGGFTAKGGVQVANYVDTTAANLSRIRQYSGATIFTTSDNVFWVRNGTATAWLKIGSNVSPAGTDCSLIGGIVTPATGLTFDITMASYCISDTPHVYSGGQITLDAADASLPRIDVIGLDNTGNAFKITGIPATDPAVPQVDPSTQLYLTHVYISAGATTPTGVSSYTIWDENTEWTGSATGVTVDFNNTSTVYHLTKSTDVGIHTTNDLVSYAGSGVHLQGYNVVKFFINLKSAMPANRNISIGLFTNSQPMTNYLTLSAAHGFNKSLVGQWQVVTVPFTDFNYLSESPLTGLKFRIQGAGAGFYLDWITLNGGLPTNTFTNALTNIYRIAGTTNVMKVVNGVASLAFVDSVGSGGGSGSIDYVVPGFGVKVDSINRTYTVSADTNKLALKDTIKVKMPLYVSGDTLEFLKDSSYLVKNIFLKTGTDSVFKTINGVDSFAFLLPSGSSGSTVTFYGKNATLDSTVLLLSDGTRFAAKDSVGSGGGSGTVTSVALTMPGTLFDATVVGSPITTTGTFLPALKSQSAYTLFGRGSGSGAPSFLASIDSNWVTGLHSENYYNTKYAAIGGGASAAGVTDDIQFNSSGTFAADTSFKFNKTGVGVVHTKKFASFKLASGTTAQANGDTIVGMFLKPLYNINGKTTVKTYDINIGKNYISLDSLYNYSIGNGSAARPSGGHLIAIGFNAGSASGTTDLALMFGRQAGYLSSGADRSIFMGGNAGLNSVNSSYSNIFGVSAGSNSTTPNSNVFGASAAISTNASYINAFGFDAGSGATGANNSNFFGGDANFPTGKLATGAYSSNMFGQSTGYQAVNGYYDNFFGRFAGAYTTNVNNSNMFGRNAGFAVKNTTGANMFGRNVGSGASGADYSNFFGFNAGDSATHKITGQNNILIGTNITTPSASSTNTMNIGGVLFGTNFYGTVAGAPSKVAQTNGQIGINVETPDASAALEVKSTTAGVLMPRMTATEASAIISPADGLIIYATDTNGTFTSIGFWGRENGAWIKL